MIQISFKNNLVVHYSIDYLLRSVGIFSKSRAYQCKENLSLANWTCSKILFAGDCLEFKSVVLCRSVSKIRQALHNRESA